MPFHLADILVFAWVLTCTVLQDVAGCLQVGKQVARPVLALIFLCALG